MLTLPRVTTATTALWQTVQCPARGHCTVGIAQPSPSLCVKERSQWTPLAQNPFVFFLSLRIKCCSLVLSQTAHWEFRYTGKLTIILCYLLPGLARWLATVSNKYVFCTILQDLTMILNLSKRRENGENTDLSLSMWPIVDSIPTVKWSLVQRQQWKSIKLWGVIA